MAKSNSIAFEDVAVHMLETFRDVNDLDVKIQREGGFAHGKPDVRYIRGRKHVCGFDAKKLIKEKDGCQPTRYTVRLENGRLIPTKKTISRENFKTPAFEKIQKNIELFSQTGLKSGKTAVRWTYIPDNAEDQMRFENLDPNHQEQERYKQEQETLAQFVAEDYARKEVDFVLFGENSKFVSPATATDMQRFSTFSLTSRYIRRGTQDIPKKDQAGILEILGLSKNDPDVLIERSKGITIFNASQHEISEDVVKAMIPAHTKDSRSFDYKTDDGRIVEILLQFDRLTDTIVLKKRGQDTKGSEYSVVVVEKFLGESDEVKEFYTDRAWTDVLIKCLERLDEEPKEDIFAIMPDMTEEKAKKREKFLTVATHRTMEAAKKIEMLGKCADPNAYEYSQEDFRLLIEMLRREVAAIEKQFL